MPVKKPRKQKQRYFDLSASDPQQWPDLSAYQLPEFECPEGADDAWIFSLCLLRDEKATFDIFDIRSSKIYSEPEEALSDAYSIIETLGYQVNPDHAVEMEIYYWNPEEEEYVRTVKWFDGQDFYQENPNKNDEEEYEEE